VDRARACGYPPDFVVVSDFLVSVVMPPEVVDCVLLDAVFGGDALPAVVSVLLLVVVSV